jgi:hypothetical protein
MTLNNRIKMIENNQTQAIIELKKSQENQKQVEYIKSELKNMLLCELLELNNLYNFDTKAEAIEKVINNTTTLLYNKNFTRQFLNEKYYQVARQVEQIKKKTATNNDIDYKQKIAIEKWNLQRQKELLKIEKLKQDINKNNIKYNIKQSQQRTTTRTIYKASGSGGEVAKVLLYLMFAPIAIFGIIIYGFISAAAKSK